MKKTTSILKKELLERNRNILKALHDLYDFDFQADFDILKIKGRFTANSIKKLLNIKNFDDHNVCLILCDIKYQESYNYIVKASNSGFVIDFNKYVYYRGVDHFWGKGQFEDKRKDDKKTVYIICQLNSLKKECSKKNPDYNERFDFVRSIGWSDGHGKHGVSQFDIKDLQHNGKQINIKTIEASASTDINYYIDKSGYLIEAKKYDLKRRAKRLKAEREKSKVDLISFDNEINLIKKELFLINRKIGLKMVESNSFDDLSIIDKVVTKIKWFYIGFERFQKSNSEKCFSSIENANARLCELKNDLNKIKNIINEVEAC